LRFIKQKIQAHGKKAQDDACQPRNEKRQVLRFSSASLHSRTNRNKQIKVIIGKSPDSPGSASSSEKMKPSYPSLPSPANQTFRTTKFCPIKPLVPISQPNNQFVFDTVRPAKTANKPATPAEGFSC